MWGSRVVATVAAVFVCIWPAGAPAAAGTAAAPSPVATPTPEPPLPGQGPGGLPVGGPRLGSLRLTLPAGAPAPPKDISARAWVLADLDTGDVLAARNAHSRYPPASTLKVLTALTLLPELPDRRRKVACVDADIDVDGTRVGLVAGGRYTVDVLFQAMLMASGNDAANTLARLAGGVPHTLAAMNAQARRLQAYDTHAATPSGLDGPGQLTSAYDLALIARAALARADFRRYTAQRTGHIPAQGRKYRGFEFANNNKLLYRYPGAFGGKNGFTDAARHTFIGAARHGTRRLVVSLMYGEHRPAPISEQAARLLDWGFALPRSLPPVGTLVDPVRPGAAASPTASPGAAAGTAARAPAPAARSTADGPRAALLLGGLAVALVLGAGGVAAARRRR